MWCILRRLPVLMLITMAAGPALLQLHPPMAAQLDPILLPLAVAQPPLAQRHVYSHLEAPLPMGQHGLDVATVMAAMEARGFSQVQPLRWRGRSLLCEATSPRRERLRLVVDTATGEITGFAVLAQAPDDVMPGP
ncbi:hypothetical protein [Xanthobacter variabilis]|uniref:hypothetical protein n=1 Tax=Xanthobacter variabilis TaxID=3119932 RepID=UPI0037289B9A